MLIHGLHLIAGKQVSSAGDSFSSTNWMNGQSLEGHFMEAAGAEVDAALQAADQAFPLLRAASVEQRAQFLELLADKVLALGDDLLNRTHAETALPMARLQGERARAIGQCKLFANLIREGSWAQPCIDRALPERQPLPKPDVRRVMQPIGPVVVFGASNFPFAIGVIGTDTVCALAAGCSVVMKGHPAHPGTCELLAECVSAALKEAGLPAGAFSLLQGRNNALGEALVEHPLTQAVAFTGSLKGGRALADRAASRPQPIPFYGEMGSVNPVFLLPGALKVRAAAIAESYIGSVNMGVGQFCTNPAIVLGLQGAELDNFIQCAADAAAKVLPATMLHSNICQAYEQGTEKIGQTPGVTLVGKSGSTAAAHQAACAIYRTELKTLQAQPHLQHEVFGPSSIIAQASSKAELLHFAQQLEGQLTATLHGTAEDLAEYADLVQVLERKVGRIIFNGFPTGIEVCPSMHHGGPYPAASHSFFTSIGTASIYRFVRPVCYQGFPDEALPELLRNKNRCGCMRLIDGVLTQADV